MLALNTPQHPSCFAHVSIPNCCRLVCPSDTKLFEAAARCCVCLLFYSLLFPAALCILFLWHSCCCPTLAWAGTNVGISLPASPVLSELGPAQSRSWAHRLLGESWGDLQLR